MEIPEQSGNASNAPAEPDPAQSGNGSDAPTGPEPIQAGADGLAEPESAEAENEADGLGGSESAEVGEAPDAPVSPEAMQDETAADVPPGGPEEAGDASGVPRGRPEPIYVVDVVVGTTVLAAATARAVERRARRVVRPVVRPVARVARPVARIALRPPLVPSRFHAERLLAAVGRQGGGRRPEVTRQLSALLDLIVPAIANALLSRIDLTKIVAERVDLNEVVAAVDLDKAVEHLDLDAVVARLDLDSLIARLDLAGLAEGVIAEVDLAEIIRQSSGSVASDTVQGVRLQGISGDEAVGRAVGRLRLRLTRHHEVAPGP